MKLTATAAVGAMSISPVPSVCDAAETGVSRIGRPWHQFPPQSPRHAHPPGSNVDPHLNPPGALVGNPSGIIFMPFWSNPEDDRWGRLCGAASTSQLLKTKGLWAYPRCTLNYNKPVDPPRMKVRPLAVLAAEQVATHMPEDKVTKPAQDHVDLINIAGIKQKKNKGKRAMPPTLTQTQKKARTNQQDTVEGSGAIRCRNITPGRPSTTTSDESFWNN